MRRSGPRQFGSTEHLSTEAIAAFVDGELRMNAHLRAAHHLSLCPQCAAEVEAQRQARAALRDSRPIAIPEFAARPAVPDSAADTAAGRAPAPTTRPQFADGTTRGRRKRR